MLRKRSRSVQKDQYKGHLIMSDSGSESNFQPEKLGKNTSFFSVPGLFVGFSIKATSDYDSVRSPTSPLDFKLLTGNSRNGSPKSWDCSKVGLGIIDSLGDVKKSSEDVVGLSSSRNILLGSQMRMNNFPSSQSRLYRSIDSSVAPKSLPNNYAIYPQPQSNDNLPGVQFSGWNNSEITGEMHSEPNLFGIVRSDLSYTSKSMSRLTGLGYCNNNLSSESFWSDNITKSGFLLIGEEPMKVDNFLGMKPSSLPISIGSGNGLIGSLTASEIELSEDYTCIISHGPNPRTTHIFGDCVLECHTTELADCATKEEPGIGTPKALKCSNSSLAYPSDDFLSFCYFCKKKLEEGNDIYMYRGEKAFCSSACRDQEILVEEEMDKPVINSSGESPKSTCSDDIFLMAVAIAFGSAFLFSSGIALCT
ncbi:hypothetical protein IFM89_022100 [Coptis chinensis]|uniref:FLZ-type domain-containing protein n=1 Tax=Coptis chinensis TaxID=261450 RepID=A0A835M3K8_9MAGN|nr:hypothetical protein IFM89_022100 [Coptis chinensis]